MSWSVDCAHSWGSLLTRPRDQWQSTARGEPSLVDLKRIAGQNITGTEEAVCSLCVVWPASEGYCKLASWHAREEGQGLPSHPLPCTRGRVGPFCGWTSEREREREREREADRQTERQMRAVACRVALLALLLLLTLAAVSAKGGGRVRMSSSRSRSSSSSRTRVSSRSRTSTGAYRAQPQSGCRTCYYK